jgi:8-oxo-dGTP pyrophosphatase MutT (NUDIX family)
MACLAAAGVALLLCFFWDPVIAFYKTAKDIFNFLGVGLASLVAAVVSVYRRLRRRIPPKLPSPLAFRVGGWEPPVPFILADGIDLNAPHKLGPGEIICREATPSFSLPEELAAHRTEIIEAYSKKTLCRLTDGRIVRLEEFSLLRTPDDEYPNWLLKFSPLSYYDFVCTNLALTGSMRLTELPRDALAALNCFRKKIEKLPSDFQAVIADGRLGNGVTVHINVIDADQNLLVGRRPPNLSIFPGRLVTSVTGAVAWTDRAAEDLPPDPFLAAVREAREETGISLRRQDIRFFALGMQADQRHPLLLGEARIPGRLAELVRLSRDSWENERFYNLNLEELPLCASVLVWGDWLPASAVAVCLSLLSRHGYEKVEKALAGARKDLYRRWLEHGRTRRRERGMLLG